ncbi:MAG: flagellar biosynthetic protein FliR [Pseudomonadota bacterium]
MGALAQHDLVGLLAHWIYPFLRIGGLFLTAPVVGTRVVPARARLVMCLAISIAVLPVLPVPSVATPFGRETFFLGAQQLLLGMLMGLVLRLTFLVVELAGQVIAQQMGLGFASLVDPQTGLQVPVLSQFYITLATLMFLSFDAHLVLISILVESFSAIPVGGGGVNSLMLGAVLSWTEQLFSGALAVALPVIIALLIVNIAFGVVTRAAPQLNIFAIGFPVIMLFGIFLCYLTLDGLSQHMKVQFEHAFSLLRSILVVGGNG